MPDPLPCTRCGSDAVIPRVRVIDRGDGNMRQELERTREALADAHVRLQELEEKLAFVAQLLEPRHPEAR